MATAPTSTPTPEGLRRYAATDGYYRIDDSVRLLHEPELVPCTCGRGCSETCTGRCGCVACEAAWVAKCVAIGVVGIDDSVASDRDWPDAIPG